MYRDQNSFQYVFYNVYITYNRLIIFRSNVMNMKTQQLYSLVLGDSHQQEALVDCKTIELS